MISRIWIEKVEPEIDGGRYPIKRTAGETVEIEADVFSDGHDKITAEVWYRQKGSRRWRYVPMEPQVNDRWRAEFAIEREHPYEYTVAGAVDRFASLRHLVKKKLRAGQGIQSELLESGIQLSEVAGRASKADAEWLRRHVAMLDTDSRLQEYQAFFLSNELERVVSANPDRDRFTRYERLLSVWVDRERARFGAWYEFFPRSTSPVPGRSGTFQDAVKFLPRVAKMGFQIVYLPPIHPIGETHRKGRNNALIAEPGDPGSPWAIGSKDGGHKSVAPELGTLEDFRDFVQEARKLGLETALDIAYQCSPDHPYVKKHSDWFYRRPDGSIHYAENPPKKYQDIYPLNFECDDWKAMWAEMKSIFDFWIEQGVEIFRVDNPHTKPFPFWEWTIAEIHKKHPGVIFLSEAFTRPKVKYALAKLGYTQSYTYFTWRNHKSELREYLEELSSPPVSDFFRPNFFANTPDILTPYLQQGGPPAFRIRLVLAATLSSNYGIYSGYELCESEAFPGKEEYAFSEKYEVKFRDWEQEVNISGLITAINKIRSVHPALQHTNNVEFIDIDSDQMIAYVKRSTDGRDSLLVIVTLDPFHWREATVEVPLDELGLPDDASYEVTDLLTGTPYHWHGRWNYVRLDPSGNCAHIFQLPT